MLVVVKLPFVVVTVSGPVSVLAGTMALICADVTAPTIAFVPLNLTVGLFVPPTSSRFAPDVVTTVPVGPPAGVNPVISG